MLNINPRWQLWASPKTMTDVTVFLLTKSAGHPGPPMPTDPGLLSAYFSTAFENDICQILIVLSPLPEASVFPSGLKARASTRES